MKIAEWNFFRVVKSIGWLLGGIILLGWSVDGGAEPLTLLTPLGPVTIDVSHVGPAGDLISPEAPSSPSFRPPTIFSAPLPSGSGARALGMAGAFTALADDATAASWNPGALVQLQRPEVSWVLRYSYEDQKHFSDNAAFQVGDDQFDRFNLNYLSAVYPFALGSRSAVFSLNYQEVYDFTQQFTAHMQDAARNSREETKSETYAETKEQTVHEDYSDHSYSDMRVTEYLTTQVTTPIDQMLSQDMLTDLSFDQQGIIDAISPALAVEVLPSLSAGGTLNIYRDDLTGTGKIRSRMVGCYAGTSESVSKIFTRRETAGTYTYEGTAHLEPGGMVPIPIDIPFSGQGVIEPFSEEQRTSRSRGLLVEGTYEEINEFKSLSGLNATLGALWTVHRHLTLGATIDLPWTADATQKKTVRNTATTYNETHTRVLDETSTEEVEEKDVSFDFPLYWALGATVKWTPRLYSTLDVNQTLWSDFAFQAEGEEKINPLDGTPHGLHEIDDCWAVKYGMEYLMLFSSTEIPLRGGVGWEQRPAIGRPDEFWVFSLGSGLSLGKDPGKLILDIAYQYTMGRDVLGSLVPDQPTSTDVDKQEVYVSGIWHF
ncbi:MAG: hypothetical protein V2A34_10255 [Lentisphaerota bacterium]